MTGCITLRIACPHVRRVVRQDKVDLAWKHWVVHSAPAAHNNPLTGCLEQVPWHFRPSGHVHNSVFHVCATLRGETLFWHIHSALFSSRRCFYLAVLDVCPIHNICERTTNYQRTRDLLSSRHFEWGKKNKELYLWVCFLFLPNWYKLENVQRTE